MGFSVIEISEDKFGKMAEYTEKMLKYGGKLMSCISEMGEEYGMSFRDEEHYRERGGMNYREHEEYGRYGKHSGGMNERYPYMGMRDEEDYEDEMNERRGGRRRRSNGRYY
jgi:hypothetical protein